MKAVPLRFEATRSKGEVGAFLVRPPDARVLYVFGHGAGAGPRHAFMEAMSTALADRGVATFRYAFPYMEAGSRRPDPGPILRTTVRSAVARAREASPDLPVVAGGKSMGGRMTSLAASEVPVPGVLGLAFVGFPLHPARKPGVERAEHLTRVGLPMLFLQGTRDALAELDLLRGALEPVRPRPTLHVVEGADHGFHVLKRSGRTDADVLEELADTLRAWAEASI